MNYQPSPPPNEDPLSEYLYRELKRIAASYKNSAPTVMFRTQSEDAGTLSAGISANWKLPAGNILRLSASATLTLTGFADSTPWRERALINVGTAPVVFLSESSASSASYRLALVETLRLGPNGVANFWYDPASFRHRLLSTVGPQASQSTWTAVVRGSGTAGTYEIDTQNCTMVRIGRFCLVNVYILLAGAVTGGGTGDLQITGLTVSHAGTSRPVGACSFNSVNYVATANLAISFTTPGSDNKLYIRETNDNAGGSIVPISGAVANSQIFATICFEAAN